MGGHVLRKHTIARSVETGEIVEEKTWEALAGWGLDPMSEVASLGGIWERRWIIANLIWDYYFSFKALPHRQRHCGTDHFCMSGIPVGCVIRGWVPVNHAVSFKFNVRHSTNNNNTWTLTANPVRNGVQHGPADSAM